MQERERLLHDITRFVRQAGRGEVAGIELLARGGSDRLFFRVQSGEDSLVVMHDPRIDDETASYVAIAHFLAQHGLGAPEILEFDEAGRMVLMEDLGDATLQHALQDASSQQKVIDLYRSVTAYLVRMQHTASEYLDDCRVVTDRSFGYEQFRAETRYFLERFIGELCGVGVTETAHLDNELHRLAEAVAAEPRVFMHRDFQSENIYITGKGVRVIDFQSATQGLPQYDLAALLKDAYYRLEARERKELLGFYLMQTGTCGRKKDEEHFIRLFHLAGLQRNMQALGAFAFLSMHKGKEPFRRHIPPALSLLAEGLQIVPEFPVLQALVRRAGRCL